MRLISLGINRAMPMPDGLRATTKFTIVAMYCAKNEDGVDDIEGTKYSYHHFDEWENVLAFMTDTPIGTPLKTIH